MFCNLEVRAGAAVARMSDSEALLLTQSLVVKIPDTLLVHYKNIFLLVHLSQYFLAPDVDCVSSDHLMQHTPSGLSSSGGMSGLS